MQVHLRNKKILITREKKQADIFAQLIQSHHGIPVQLPLLKINTLTQSNLNQLNFSDMTWIFFTSSNGVDSFFQLMKKDNCLSQIKHCHFAAVGTKTAEALTKKQQTIDFIPTKFNADTMAEEFSKKYPNSGKILLVRGNLSRDVLPREFARKGYDVEKVEVYETIQVNNIPQDRMEAIKEVDFITFTSPSTVEAFSKATNTNQLFLHFPAVCIGMTTAKRAKEIGFEKIIVPEVYTIEAMLEALHKYLVAREDR